MQDKPTEFQVLQSGATKNRNQELTPKGDLKVKNYATNSMATELPAKSELKSVDTNIVPEDDNLPAHHPDNLAWEAIEKPESVE